MDKMPDCLVTKPFDPDNSYLDRKLPDVTGFMRMCVRLHECHKTVHLAMVCLDPYRLP